MKKVIFAILAISTLSFSCYFVLSASETEFEGAKEVAIKYETNITDAISGGFWEIPSDSDEFEPDKPKGKYEKQSISPELTEKYNNYCYILDHSGYLDAEYSYDDVEEAQLTKEELLNLSDVSFMYYYDYRTNNLIQYFTVSWVDKTITTGYVVWSNGFVIEYRRF